MKRPALALLTAAGLALTGCASQPAAAPMTVTETAPATSNTAATTSAAPSTHATPTPSPTLSAAPLKNDRGNIVKKAGQRAGIGYEDQGLDIDFTVTKISPAAKCTLHSYSKPENGRLVSLELKAKTKAGILDTIGWDSISFYSDGDWQFVDEKGTVANGSPISSATFACVPDGATLPTLGPAQQGKGVLIFDVPKRSGSLIFRPYWGSGGHIGWEWKIPAA